MLFAIGLPYKRSVTLDRERITNVETASRSVRFEYQRSTARHNVGRRQAVTCEFETPGVAEEFAGLLPGERTPDFRPQLADELAFEQRLRAHVPQVPVVMALIALNIVAFVMGVAHAVGWPVADDSGLVGLGSNFGPYTTDGEWWRLVTANFLHLGILHLALNMWALAAMGPLVERLYGSWIYLFIYLVTGVASALTSISWDPAVHSVGASGAILGGYGALLATLLRGRGLIPRGVIGPMRDSTWFYVLSIFVVGLFSSSVDNAAHVGGFVAGFAMGLVLPVPFAPVRAIGQHRLRLALGATLAVSLIVMGVTIASSRASSLAGESRFSYTHTWFAEGERVASVRWRSVKVLAREGKLDDEAAAHIVETELLPFWEEADRRFHGIQLPETSLLRDDLTFMTEFVVSRRDAYRICLMAMRKRDTEIAAKCQAGLTRGDEIVDQHRSGK
jgi:rhomboid protease GluP